jgi:flagellar protein FliO/FliZ
MMRPASAAFSSMRSPVPHRLFALLAALFLAHCLSAAPTDENQVIVPNSSVQKTAPAPAVPTGSGTLTAIGVLVLAGAGGWLVWRGRKGGIANFNRNTRQLVIEETRSLGSRQFLVVATYQDKKFLLGVCPGRIDLLAPLNASTSAPEKVRL